MLVRLVDEVVAWQEGGWYHWDVPLPTLPNAVGAGTGQAAGVRREGGLHMCRQTPQHVWSDR